MKLTIEKIIAILFFSFSCFINIAKAEFFSANRLGQPLPTASFFPNENPIVFPGFNVAAGVNASALTNERGRSLQAGFSPAIAATDNMGFFGSFATHKGNSGFGLGYVGSLSPAQTANHSAFLGYAYQIKTVSLGLAVRDLNIINGGLNIDLSTNVQVGNMRIAAVLYHIDAATQVALGIGLKSSRTFTAELNVLTPSLNNLAGNYTLTAAATMNFGPVGFHLRTSYYTYWGSFNYTLGGYFWFSDKLNIFAQYTTSRTVWAGLTFTF